MTVDQELAVLRRRVQELENRLDRRRPDPILIQPSDANDTVVMRGVMAASVASGSSSVVNVVLPDGTSGSVSGHLWLPGSVATAKKVYVATVGTGYDIIAADCP